MENKNEEFVGKISPREREFNAFKLEALSLFEAELDALTYGMKNEDEVNVEFHLAVRNATGDNRYERQTISRHCDREIALCNPKTVEDLQPVTENKEEK